MTRACDRLAEQRESNEPRGCQYVAGFLVGAGVLAAFAPIVRWIFG